MSDNSISANNSRIVFASDEASPGNYDIYVINADGTAKQNLTNSPAVNDRQPSWSPDGSRIAFLTDRNGRWEVWVMNVDGSNQRPMFSEAVNNQLEIFYHGNDARMLGWGK